MREITKQKELIEKSIPLEPPIEKFGVQGSLFDDIVLTEENMKAIKRYNRKNKEPKPQTLQPF